MKLEELKTEELIQCYEFITDYLKYLENSLKQIEKSGSDA